jgi:hypothetical protein
MTPERGCAPVGTEAQRKRRPTEAWSDHSRSNARTSQDAEIRSKLEALRQAAVDHRPWIDVRHEVASLLAPLYQRRAA